MGNTLECSAETPLGLSEAAAAAAAAAEAAAAARAARDPSAPGAASAAAVGSPESGPGERISRGGRDSFPLPQSPLWAHQRAFYSEIGAACWREDLVPSFASSNGFVAAGYARAAFEFASGLAARERGPCRVQLLEIGAGAGQLADAVIKRLAELNAARVRGGGAALDFRYILTDFHQGMLDFWLQHEPLARHFEAGLLDTALLDAEAEAIGPLRLQYSGELLLPRAEPVVCVCNYVFDSLVQDAFEVKGGRMYRARLELCVSAAHAAGSSLDEEAENDQVAALSDAGSRRPGSDSEVSEGSHSVGSADERAWAVGALEGSSRRERRSSKGSGKTAKQHPQSVPLDAHHNGQLLWSFDFCEPTEDRLLALEMLPSGSVAERAALVEVLRSYADMTPPANAKAETGCVLVPLGALRLLPKLLAFAPTARQTLLLVGDKGFGHPDEFLGQQRDPALASHGSLSFMANFHFIEAFVRRVYPAAEVVCSDHQEGFKVMGVLFQRDDEIHGPCVAALHRLARGFGPEHFLALNETLGAAAASNTGDGHIGLLTSLALLRLARFDAHTFLDLRASLLARCASPGLTPEARREVRAALTRVEAGYYHLVPSQDVAFELGRVYMALGDHARALELLRRSLRECGAHHVTRFNIGMCEFQLGHLAEARASFEQVLEAKPRSKLAQSWHDKTRQQQEEQQGAHPHN